MTLSPEDFARLSSEEQDEIALIDLQLEELEQIEGIQKDFRKFIPAFWSTVDPAPFKPTWVTDALAEHLQACYERQIRRLKINVHFRSAKSTLTSILWPAWIWGQTPEEKFLFMSYAEKLALTHAGHFRKCIKSDLYRSLYKDKFSLTKDSDGEIENTKLGARLSIGSASQQTGSGGGIKVFDDPNDTNKVEYVVDRDNVNGRFDNMSTRSDDFATDVWVLIQQRTHPNDVSGHVDDLGGLGFETLNIPLEYDGNKYVTSIGWSDPRTKIGEVTDEDRFPHWTAEERGLADCIPLLKASLGFRYSGQANQNPTTPEGSAIRREWYPEIAVFDPTDVEALVLAYDVGFSSSSDADWTWGSVKVRLTKGNLLNLVELTLAQHYGKWDNPDRDRECSQFGAKLKALIDTGIFPKLQEWEVVVEAGVGPGVKIVNDFRDALLAAGLPARTQSSNVNKVIRSNGYVATCQYKKCGFYKGTQLPGFTDGTVWIKKYFEIVTQLKYDNAPDGTPRFVGEHDDPLDAEAMAHDAVTRPESVALEQPILFY